MNFNRNFRYFALAALCILSACRHSEEHSSVSPPPPSDGRTDPGVVPPTRLAYLDIAGVVGRAIAPNMPDFSGGEITRYAIAPTLPSGLMLDASSGVISGVPTAASELRAYTVTGANDAGSVQAAVKIEIVAPAPPVLAPTNLSYATPTATYFLNRSIAPNAPSAAGGPVERYGVSSALPAGLELDAASGVITGVPKELAAASAYTITASNVSGSIQAALSIEVVDQAPGALTYDEKSPVYAQYGAMTPNTPRNTGGRITSYSIAPALPAGMSLDSKTGVIGGRPTTLSSASYVVTGTNRTGSTQATLQIAVKFPATPTYTIGDAIRVPVRGADTWYINDSVFPFVPNASGTGYLSLLGAGGIRRYVGTGWDDLAPKSNGTNGAVTITYAPGVDHSTANGWAANGRWMLQAARAADGTLVGFVHGENHVFADGKYGEWNSTGLLTSQDDGLTWIDYGQIVASKKPATGQFGGMGLSEAVWDATRQRWLGYGGGTPFMSNDPHGLPGTWYGYANGSFSVRIDPTAVRPTLSAAPGLEKAVVTWGGLTYNTYLRQFILTWMPYGDTKSVRAAFSPDGLHWGPVKTLFAEQSPYSSSYSFIVGDTDTQSGEDCYLVYMRGPAVSGNRKDMIRRPIHFQLNP